MTRMTRSSYCLLCALVAIIWTATSPQVTAAGITPRYGITDLGVMQGTTSSIATGINGSGQVVGVSYNTNDSLHHTYDSNARSFLYRDGTTTEIQPIGGPARSINDAGQVVGGGYVAINSQGQFIGQPATYDGRSDLEPGQSELVSGGVSTNLLGFVPNALSDSGMIAGHTFTSTGGGSVSHAAYYQDGHVTDINGALNNRIAIRGSAAMAINKSNDILAQVIYTNNQLDTVLYSNGIPVFLGRLAGAPGSFDAKGINNLGQIVGKDFLYQGGQFETTSDGIHYLPGEFLKLTDLVTPGSGWSDLVATAINDEGLIVGQGTINGQQRAFLMAPAAVPEPSTLIIFGTAFVAGGIRWTVRDRSRRNGERTKR